MKYKNPSIRVLGSAVEVVKGGKAAGSPTDGSPSFKNTMNAYEADE